MTPGNDNRTFSLTEAKERNFKPFTYQGYHNGVFTHQDVVYCQNQCVFYELLADWNRQGSTQKPLEWVYLAVFHVENQETQ